MKMKAMLGLFLILTVSACGRTGTIDPAFSTYVDAFNQAGNLKADNTLTVKFGTIDTSTSRDTLANCNEDTNTITVDTSNWPTGPFNDDFKKLVIFHELGHCLLHRGHNPAVDANGVPVSIMNPEPTSFEQAFGANTDQYIQELFNANRSMQ